MKTRQSRESRVVQGDVIRDVELVEYVKEKRGIIEVSKIIFPVAVVLTQDCDLAQDFKFRWSRDNRPTTQDKFLLSVLVAPLYNVEHVYEGTQLSELDLQMASINKKKTPGEYLRNNERPRYHFVDFDPSVPVVPSVVDFKHYFSVNGIYLKGLKRTHFVCRVPPLFREDLSLRFANYLARIGLPDAVS